jgi:nitrate/nitrite transporter NarK
MDWLEYDESSGLKTKKESDKYLIIGTILAALAMLICGYISETTNNMTFYWIGFAFLLVMYGIIWYMEQDKRKDPNYKPPQWPFFFIIIWVLYGFSTQVGNRDLFYNLLDLVAKAMFALCAGLF